MIDKQVLQALVDSGYERYYNDSPIKWYKSDNISLTAYVDFNTREITFKINVASPSEFSPKHKAKPFAIYTSVMFSFIHFLNDPKACVEYVNDLAYVILSKPISDQEPNLSEQF